MTHEYVILFNGQVAGAIVGPHGTRATAIAYAEDTILAVGDDETVRAVSRGDSTFVDLAGRTVEAPAGGVLQIGAPATFTVVALEGGPRAVVRDGRLVEGWLPIPPATGPDPRPG